ncbi:MAG: hypothetical protein PHW10_04155 [Candidatus Peribacteraceae bacterium]|nr:hypothetical protein [Candidatus Peribacteraceae bacterium]
MISAIEEPPVGSVVPDVPLSRPGRLPVLEEQEAEEYFMRQFVENVSFISDAVRALLHGCVMEECPLSDTIALPLGLDARHWTAPAMEHALLSLAVEDRRGVLIAVIRANAAFQRP